MREIKFRAWDKKEKKMCLAESTQLDICFNGYVLDNGQMTSNRYILLQYTGLKDKNGAGQEIYEGDICKFIKQTHIGDSKMKVVFKNGSFCLQGFQLMSSDHHYFPNSVIGKKGEPNGEIEVIGNIYENRT